MCKNVSPPCDDHHSTFVGSAVRLQKRYFPKLRGTRRHVSSRTFLELATLEMDQTLLKELSWHISSSSDSTQMVDQVRNDMTGLACLGY